MTTHQLYYAIRFHFPHIEAHDALITARNFATMDLTSIKALLANLKNTQNEYTSLVAFIVQQLEISTLLEEEIQPLWAKHQIEDEYYHCCGSW